MKNMAEQVHFVSRFLVSISLFSLHDSDLSPPIDGLCEERTSKNSSIPGGNGKLGNLVGFWIMVISLLKIPLIFQHKFIFTCGECNFCLVNFVGDVLGCGS